MLSIMAKSVDDILTDAGEPAIADSIGITLWNRDELWFSSRWTGVKTEEELLDGGNLVIH